MPRKKPPWKQRKWWAGLLTCVAMFVQYYTGVDVTDAFTNLTPLFIWLVTEGVIDGIATIKLKD